MTEQTDYNTMPLDELEKMVAGIPTSQMDTENPQQPEEKSDTEVKDKSEPQPEEAGSESTDEPKEEEKPAEPEKKTPESIKKLLHQRSELRQDNDRLRAELDEANEQLRKLRS